MKLKPEHNAVIYSLPGNSEFRICRQNDFNVSEKHDKSESYFVVRPFNDDKKVLFIRADVHENIDLSELVVESYINAPNSEAVQQSDYERLISKTIDRSQEINGKIIVSRIDEASMQSFNLTKSLQNLRNKFPQSFIYFLISKQYGIWLGATPETLVEKEGELLSTMALAGTKWGGELFTQKEFDEQMLVSRDIMDCLSKEVVEIGDVHEMNFGELRHLRTNFRWQSEDSILRFAELLHPTSAICGFPRAEALEFILSNEEHERGLYSGYLGFVDSNHSQLFVNLRCMRLFDNQIRVHVGGGINAKSDPISEWEETVRKSNSVTEAIAHG